MDDEEKKDGCGCGEDDECNKDKEDKGNCGEGCCGGGCGSKKEKKEEEDEG